jgi:WD40 repeat protein
MPNFPIYRGEVPEVLSPLKLRHYWLLAYWVYFRPTAFHCYLNAAAPDLDRLRGFQRFLRTWRVRAYRNVYLMLPIAIALLSLLLGLVVFLYSINIFQANPTWVNAIAITQNGQTAVSATATRDLTVNVVSPDSSLKVWNLRWGTQMHVLRGHYYGVTAVALTPDGKRAVSASRDRTLKIWDIRRGTLLHTLNGHREWVTSVVVTPDGQRAVSASADKTLKIWDIKTGKLLQTLSGHSDVISALALTSDGQRAVSASADKTLKVWDLEQGKELYTLTGHSSWVTSVALTPNGGQAVSTSADKTLKVWDLEQGKELYTLTGHSGWVTGVAVSPDGQQAVSAATDQTLKVWDLQQGTALGTLTGHNGWVTSVAIAPDGRQAVSASSDQTLKVWDLQQFKAVHTLSGHHAWVTAMAITPKTPRIISASFQGYPKLWSLKRGTELPMRGVVAQAVGLNIGLGTVLPVAVLTGAISVAILLASGVMAFGVPGTIVSSFIPGVMSSLIFCVAFVVTARIAADPILNQQYKLDNAATVLTILFGILLGIIISVTFGLSSRTALGVLGSIVFILLLGAALGLIVSCLIAPGITLKGRLRPGIRAFETVSITFNLLVAFGAFRLPFYPIQLVLALLSRFRGKWHPAVWDELLVLPVPGTTALLQAHLRASEREGLQRVADVVRNPFQRVWAQRALHHYLHSVAAPLHFLYHLLTYEDLNTYVVAPISQRDWQLLPTTKQVLLGELANQKVDCTSEGLNYLAENVVWGLTWLGRDRHHSPLTRFAAMLYQLSYTKIVEAEDFNLSSYKDIYTGLTQYPGGTEIADSFAALARFLTYESLSDLTGAGDVVSELCVDETAIRPPVLKALTRCGEIGSKAIAYQAAVTTVEQLAILAQMTRTLDLLEEYAIEQVVTPEQVILKRIIRQWRRVVSQAVVSSAEC